MLVCRSMIGLWQATDGSQSTCLRCTCMSAWETATAVSQSLCIYHGPAATHLQYSSPGMQQTCSLHKSLIYILQTKLKA